MDDELKQHLTAAETWTRGLFMLLIVFLMEVAKVVTGAVVVVQFLFAVFSGEVNTNLRQFGAGLAHYIFQCVQFLTYNSDDKPFPFRPWPTGDEIAAGPEAPPAPAEDDAEPGRGDDGGKTT